ncbi:FadR/GntR family transcriptional regulator [Pararobbsia alpina]|uniref:L-lactate dehydrogenase operon regulatory protein n=1 Tax=Pararobbsia alpina TaxID=621374 RepID=A0A6S7BGY1_9BURK|nr:FCD domain-containing protein [Pararobbsia alpina]CAB3798371.1 Putative L-lactate dehydrogenase operon regulatory protein [Pararobbsia alpina]
MSTTHEADGVDGALALKSSLIEGLKTGRYLAGQRLPTERQLSETFRIARSTVRRVIGQLKEKGLVRQSVGSGTYVSDEIEALLASERPSPQHNVSPAEVMEARLALEPSLIELVVRNATSTDFAEIQHCVEQAEAAATFEQFEYWDGALHQRIAEATHNNIVLVVFDAITRVRASSEWGALKRKSVTPERRAAYQIEHRALVDALVDRDIERAREATIAHLLHVRKNLLGH